jgi:hypothetical protein
MLRLGIAMRRELKLCLRRPIVETRKRLLLLLKTVMQLVVWIWKW